jgi:hypothetical protein
MISTDWGEQKIYLKVEHTHAKKKKKKTPYIHVMKRE